MSIPEAARYSLSCSRTDIWVENIFSLQGILETHYTAASYRRHRKWTNSEPLKRCFWLSLIIISTLADCKEGLAELVHLQKETNKKKVIFIDFSLPVSCCYFNTLDRAEWLKVCTPMCENNYWKKVNLPQHCMWNFFFKIILRFQPDKMQPWIHPHGGCVIHCNLNCVTSIL